MATKVLAFQPLSIMPAPVKLVVSSGGGKGRPSEGKMFPRGKP